MYNNAISTISFILVCTGFSGYAYDTSTLELVHVVFRHGDRTLDTSSTYPNDPYVNETYFPYGRGQLTNKGKLREYRIGKALRARYDNFLGDLYTPDILDAHSSEFNRTKMSLELVLAGLFPPKGTLLEWERELNWQPIPYNYVNFDSNHLITIALYYCQNYATLYNEYMNSPPGIILYQKNRKLFQFLTKQTGKVINSTFDVFFLYAGLVAEEDWGFKLPPWTEKVYPKYLEDVVADEYVLSSATPELKQMAGGFLLKKIIIDSLSKINQELIPQSRKIFLYSVHDFNIAYLLNALEVFFRHATPYGAYILIELHCIQGVHGIKIFYQDYTQVEPKSLQVPGCDYFCPLDEFITLLRYNLPADDNACTAYLPPAPQIKEWGYAFDVKEN